MKKWIFLALAGITFGLVSCSEEDNLATARGNDPTVTIYSYTPEVGDPDADVRLRIIPNSSCTSFYLLSQLKEEKDQYTPSEYLQYVMENGTEYDAAEEFDQTLTNMPDTYSITVVPMGGNTPFPAVEYVFEGSSWTTLTTVTVSQDMLTANGEILSAECPLQRNEKNANLYRVYQIFGPLGIPGGSGVPFYLTENPEYAPDGAPVGTYILADATGVVSGVGVMTFQWNPNDANYGDYMSFTRDEGSNIYVLKGLFASDGVAMGQITIRMDLTPLIEGGF